MVHLLFPGYYAALIWIVDSTNPCHIFALFPCFEGSCWLYLWVPHISPRGLCEIQLTLWSRVKLGKWKYNFGEIEILAFTFSISFGFTDPTTSLTPTEVWNWHFFYPVEYGNMSSTSSWLILYELPSENYLGSAFLINCFYRVTKSSIILCVNTPRTWGQRRDAMTINIYSPPWQGKAGALSWSKSSRGT